MTGMVPPPSPAELARELAIARLSVASYLHRQESPAAWLAIEIRAGGLRENAAVLAVIEALRRHPARADELDELLMARSRASSMTSSRV